MAIAKTQGGPRGPAPKRSDQRRRRNAEEGPEVIALPGAIVVNAPPCGEEWHPAIKELYESLKTSGQALHYEPSDWAYARYLCERESMNLQSGRPSAQMTGFFIAALSDLLVTEGARRRARVELQRGKPEESPSVGIMAKYRANLAVPTVN